MSIINKYFKITAGSEDIFYTVLRNATTNIEWKKKLLLEFVVICVIKKIILFKPKHVWKFKDTKKNCIKLKSKYFKVSNLILRYLFEKRGLSVRNLSKT